MRLRNACLLNAVLLTFAGTAQAQRPGLQGPPQPQRLQLQGVVVSIVPQSRQIVIEAQAIPGFMSAGTLPYFVNDSGGLATVSAGDAITATLIVSGGASWLEDLRPGSASPGPSAGQAVISPTVFPPATMAPTTMDLRRPRSDSIGTRPAPPDSVIGANSLP